mgnify:CR=1 FL=1
MFCFFFQAEDGIRDLVRSRGLGDVYKRQVKLSIDGIRDADQQITIDILDLYGKQVFAKAYGNNGERFTTTLDLPGDIASGTYLVHITVNGKTTVQRLSIIK